MYLKHLQLPEDEAVEIDLKEATVFLMAHLNRLALPHIPFQSFSQV